MNMGCYVGAVPGLLQQASGERRTARQQQTDCPLTVGDDSQSEGRTPSAVRRVHGGALTQVAGYLLRVIPFTDCCEQLLVQLFWR